MNAYVVMHNHLGDSSEPLAVFGKREIAEAYADAMREREKQAPGSLHGFGVEEVPLNPAVPEQRPRNKSTA